MRKVLRVLGSIVVTLIVIFSVILTTLVIIATRDKDNVPSLFGYAIMNVETDSMAGEKGFDPGTLIVVKRLTADEIENDLQPGDVITFRRFTEDNVAYLETHRIVEITPELIERHEAYIIDLRDVDHGGWKRGPYRYYITKGDNTPGVDVLPDGISFDYAYQANIFGKWTGQQIPKLGAIMAFLRSPTGFMICIVIPVAMFFIYELYVFIITLTRRQKEKALAEVSGKEDELKKKAIEEYLAQQQKESGEKADAKPADDKPDEKPADDKPAEKSDDDESDDKPAEKSKDKSKGKSKDKSKDKSKEKTEKSDEKAADESDDKSDDKDDDKSDDKDDDKSDAKDTDESDDKSDDKDDDKSDDKDDDKSDDKAADISEAEKERIIREYLAKQAAESKSEE